MSWRIHPHHGGPAVRLVRDVTRQHPTWVHEQLGTGTELELQRVLDQYAAADARGKGADSYGVEWVDDE